MQSGKKKSRLFVVGFTVISIFLFYSFVTEAEKVVVIPLMSTSSAECIHCDNNGNVGIGTTNPMAQLHVKDETDHAIIFIDAQPSGTNDAMITFHTGNRAVSMGLEDGGDNETSFHITNGDRNLDNDQYLLTIKDGGGNVGIGTTDPLSKLDVRESSDFGRDGIINANVYSGNPNPSQAIAFRAQLEGNPLDTGGAYDAFTAIDVNNGGGSADYFAFRVESGYTTAMQIQSGTIDYIGIDLKFTNGSSDILTLTGNGDIGIGTTSPGSKLAVVGLPSGTDDSVVVGTLAGALCITDTGNLYIDTDGTCAN